MKQRYQYGEKSRAGFVELRPDCEMTGNQLFDALGNVPDVLRVERQKEKQAQWNGLRNHYMEQNVKVFSELCGSDMASRYIV